MEKLLFVLNALQIINSKQFTDTTYMHVYNIVNMGTRNFCVAHCIKRLDCTETLQQIRLR